MKKIPLKSICYIAFVGIVTLSLGACSGLSTDIKASNSGSLPKGEKGDLARFPDIPIPQKATMNVERSLILGPKDAWIGRLIFTTSTNAQQVFEFYSREMPGFGWQEVTRARSKVSILTYTRGQRATTILIAGTSLGGAEVDFTISPTAPKSAPGGTMAPRR
ncbi:MAG: hypothetical protein ACKVJQ_10100 [Alphaproteobacteria bacterium]